LRSRRRMSGKLCHSHVMSDLALAMTLLCAVGCEPEMPAAPGQDLSVIPGRPNDLSTVPDGGSGFSLTVTASINLPGVPQTIAYNAGTNKAYVSCTAFPTDGGLIQMGAGIPVIDVPTNTVRTTIPFTGVVGSLAANGTAKNVYAVY